MAHEDEDDVYDKPKEIPWWLIAGGLAAVVYVGYRIDVGGDSPLPNILGDGNHPGGPTCADLDKQYPIANPAKVGYNFNGPQTATCTEIQRALQAHHSPIAPYEPQIYAAYAKQGINNAAAMGIAWQEGHYGTAPGVQQRDENIGAMRYANPNKYPNPHFSNDNGWMNFHAADTNGQATGWIASAQDHAALIRSWIDYGGKWNGMNKRSGDSSVNTIISILSPRTENNTDGYIASVKNLMNTFYNESVDYQRSHPSGDVPTGIIASIASHISPFRRVARG